jgi:hypothetical protein
MIYILWISGILCGILGTISLTYFRKFKSVQSSLDLLSKEYSLIDKEKRERESMKRLAKLTMGYHYKVDTKKIWDVIFEMREIAVSEDEKKSKFEIISITSKNKDEETEDYKKFYLDLLLKETGGGWIDVDDKRLEWISTMSKSESRDLKLKDLGI